MADKEKVDRDLIYKKDVIDVIVQIQEDSFTGVKTGDGENYVDANKFHAKVMTFARSLAMR